jgi:hypothetical protein
MEFFRNIKNSVWGPKFYQELLQKPASYSFRYYFIFALLAAVLVTIILSFSVLPEIKSVIEEFTVKALQNYPENLVIKIENGKASTNTQAPFYLKLSDDIKLNGDDITGQGDIKNLLAIDTKTPFDVNKFAEYKSYCVLSETSLACRDNGAIKTNSLEKAPNITINKEKVSGWLKEISTPLKLVYPLYFVIMITVLFLAIAFRLAYLLFFALLVWLIASLKKMNIGYSKSYQLGLHLMTPAFIITYLVSLLAPKANIPCFFTVIALIFAIINLKKSQELAVRPDQSIQPAPNNPVDTLTN